MSMNAKYVAAVTLLLCLQIAAQNAFALEGDRDLFPEEIVVGDVTLQRKGVGRMRRWMITGADVALYAPEGTSRGALLSGGPVALSFYYYVRIRGDQFSRAANETLADNIDAAAKNAQADNIEKMGNWFQTVERGDRYLLQYEPGRGTTLKLNGKPQGTIEGSAFASVYFQIWLGKHPIDTRLYDAMAAGLQ